MMGNQIMDFSATAQLLDGQLISLRRLNADDTKAALALHQHLSDFDRYFRFFTLNAIDLDKLVGKMTEPTPGQFALGAFDAERLIGVANYSVVRDDPKVAEVAIAVAHEDHSRGVGTALLKHLARIACAHGVRRFVAEVLDENHPMLTVLFDLGWPCKPMDYGTVRHVEIELPVGLADTSAVTNPIPS